METVPSSLYCVSTNHNMSLKAPVTRIASTSMDWRVNSRLQFLGPEDVTFGHVESVNAVCEGHVRCRNQTRPPGALTHPNPEFRIAGLGRLWTREDVLFLLWNPNALSTWLQCLASPDSVYIYSTTTSFLFLNMILPPYHR